MNTTQGDPVIADLTTPAATARRRGRAPMVAAMLLVAGGTAFAAGRLDAMSASASGGKTPEAAVDAMLESLSENDVLGVLDNLAPGEREVMKDATMDYVDELTRLGVLSDDVDLSGVPGFEFAYDGLTYDVEQANQRVWLVEITGGQLTIGANTAELPLGEVLFDRLELDTNSWSDTTTVDIAEVADEELQVAVVEEDGAFYVSSFYTVAELAASTEGYTLPATPIPAVGAESPEAAVRGMIDAALDLDVGRVIELTPPDEMAALHDYGPILVELADEAIVESDIESELDGWTISIDTLEFEQAEVSGGVKLLPTRIAVSGTDVEGREFEMSATKVDESCVDYAASATEVRDDGAAEQVSASGRACAADIHDAFEDSDVPIEVQQIAERMVGQLGQLGVTTVEVDGLWYVSPSRSYTDVLLVALQGLEAGDVETLWDFVESSLRRRVRRLRRGPGGHDRLHRRRLIAARTARAAGGANAVSNPIAQRCWRSRAPSTAFKPAVVMSGSTPIPQRGSSLSPTVST